MDRNDLHALLARSRDARGFTLLEILTVCAIVGVLATLAFPSIRRFNRAQETKSSATMMAGLLEEARSHAASEGTPYLVYVNDPASGGGGGAAGCGPVASVVRDSDRSYSLTAGDKVRDFSLPAGACDSVKLYGQDGSAAPFADMRMPAEDQAVLSGTLTSAVSETLSGVLTLVTAEDSGEGSSSSSSNSGKGSTTTNLRSQKVQDAVVNGSTFPVDQASGRPVIAFSERGIPVDPANPTNWGSGAGAVYMTDGNDTVYAAVVQPMGGIKLRKYEPTTGEWR